MRIPNSEGSGYLFPIITVKIHFVFQTNCNFLIPQMSSDNSIFCAPMKPTSPFDLTKVVFILYFYWENTVEIIKPGHIGTTQKGNRKIGNLFYFPPVCRAPIRNVWRASKVFFFGKSALLRMLQEWNQQFSGAHITTSADTVSNFFPGL